MKRRGAWQALLSFAAFIALSCGPEPEAALSEAPGTATQTDQLRFRPIRQALILSTSVQGAESSREAQAASAVGMDVRVVTPEQWRSMTAEQFRGYAVLILGDAACTDDGLGALQAAIDTRRTWGPIVNGNILVIASDPSTNRTPFLVERGVQFALARDYSTGLYLSLGCAYRGAAAGTAVTLLEPFGDFLVAGLGCHPEAHSFVMTPKELTSELYGADEHLRGDGCAARTVFTSYPQQSFAPVVLAVDTEGSMPGAQPYSDPYWNGSGGIFVGSPYVLARGARPRTPSSPPVAQCQNLVLDADQTCGANGSINNGSSDPDGDLVGCTQSPAGPYPLGTNMVTLTCTDSAQQSSSCTATVSVRDVTAPVVSIVGPLNVAVECGDSTYVDPGATATDRCAGSLPAHPSTVVDHGTPGSYPVRYSATDPSGNTGVSAHTREVTVHDTLPPVVTLNPPLNQTLECGTPYTDPGITVIDQCYGDLTSTIRSGTVNSNVPGTYTMTYIVVDPAGNQSRPQSRTVSVVDTLPPDITVLGPLEDSFECGSHYVDPGATATDQCFGAVPVVATRTGNPNQPGSFTITYSATDGAGNSVTSPDTRHVTVNDHEPPMLTLFGPANQVLECSSTPYSDPGAAATDQCFGDISDRIVRTGEVDSGVPGTYSLAYTVSDLAGNSAGPVHRTVHVTDTQGPTLTVAGPSELVTECNLYGIFDDPGASATDSCAGRLPVQREGEVIMAHTGVYTLEYTATDAFGNSNSATRVVEVIDTIRPVMTLIGPSSVTITRGTEYVDQGAVAEDDCEGMLMTFRIGEVNTNVPGTYELRYLADDHSGHHVEVVRYVTVVERTSTIVSQTTSLAR